MKTVKQILGESQAIDYTDRLSVLSSLGLLEESKVGLVRRSLEKNPMSMTMAESKALKEFVDNILSQMLLEKQDYLSKFDKRVPKGYPSDRDMPTVLILKRKAIRVYPDNQKVALYYSQALDRYISIPFNGARGEPLGMVMNEEYDEKVKRQSLHELAKKYSKKPNDTEPLPKELKEESVSDRFRSNVQIIREGRNPLRALNTLSKIGKQGLNKVGEYLKKWQDARKARKDKNKNKNSTEAGSAAAAAAAAAAAKRKSLLQQLGLGADNYSNPDPLGAVIQTTRPPPGTSYLPGTTETGRPPDTIPTAWTIDVARRIYGSGPGPVNALSESNLSIIRKLSRSKSLLEQKINFLDENDLTINRGAAKKIMKVYNSLNESNKGKMEKMLNESVVTFTQAINFAVRQ